MLIKRQLADGNVEVTFRIALEGVSRLSLLGDFNHWNAAAHPLAQDSDGVWSATVRLSAGEYRYRYVANGHEWLNDPQADGYAANEFGSENSIVRVEAVAAAAPQQRRAVKAKTERDAGAAPKKRVPRKKSAK
jgi:1,4-alpha-glucan branching enzyme